MILSNTKLMKVKINMIWYKDEMSYASCQESRLLVLFRISKTDLGLNNVLINSLRMSDAYTHQRNVPTSVWMMARLLFDTKALFSPVMILRTILGIRTIITLMSPLTKMLKTLLFVVLMPSWRRERWVSELGDILQTVYLLRPSDALVI